MKELKEMKENLISCVEQQINGNLEQVNTKELGEAVDMIKDLSEAIYYCTITEAMNDKYDEPKHNYYYTERLLPRMEYEDYRYSANRNGRTQYPMIYYGDEGAKKYHDVYSTESPRMLSADKDMREGRSPRYRKMYMEGQSMHLDKTRQMQELENYVQELSADMMEMIREASPEEKQMLQQKISTLATKIK